MEGSSDKAHLSRVLQTNSTIEDQTTHKLLFSNITTNYLLYRINTLKKNENSHADLPTRLIEKLFGLVDLG